MTNPLNNYERETLTALYASLDYMQCNDLPTDAVENAIAKIESKIVLATKKLLFLEQYISNVCFFVEINNYKM